MLLHRGLSSHLERLEAGIARISAGDYDSQLAPAGRSDVDAIVSGVNAMAAAMMG